METEEQPSWWGVKSLDTWPRVWSLFRLIHLSVLDVLLSFQNCCLSSNSNSSSWMPPRRAKLQEGTTRPPTATVSSEQLPSGPLKQFMSDTPEDLFLSWRSRDWSGDWLTGCVKPTHFYGTSIRRSHNAFVVDPVRSTPSLKSRPMLKAIQHRRRGTKPTRGINNQAIWSLHLKTDSGIILPRKLSP